MANAGTNPVANSDYQRTLHCIPTSAQGCRASGCPRRQRPCIALGLEVDGGDGRVGGHACCLPARASSVVAGVGASARRRRRRHLYVYARARVFTRTNSVLRAKLRRLKRREG